MANGVFNITPVLILKLEHYGSLGIMRSLGRIGVPVYGVDGNPRTVASFSRYCQGCYTWDVERAEPEATLEFLLRAARAIGGRPVLIATSDETASFVANHAWRLREAFRFHELNATLVDTLTNKRGMYELARRFGIPTPESIFPASMSDLIRGMRRLKYPVVLKGIDGAELYHKTGTRMVIVRDHRALLEHYSKLEDPLDPNLMVQEYIEGVDDSAWLYNGLFDDRSECLVSFTGRKLRLNPVYTGMTSYGMTLWSERLAASAKCFLQAIGYKGIVDLDYRFDARDGEYKLLDVNPRIGASFRLFVPDNGMDVARALYFNLTRQPVGPAHVPDGRAWLVEDKDLLSAYRYFRDGKLRVGEWLSSLRGVDETGYFAPDDPVPSWHLWKNHIHRAILKFRNGGNGSVRRSGEQASTRFTPAEAYHGRRVDIVH